MSIWFTVFQWIFVIVALLLIILVLLRKSDMAGLSSTFGGAGGDGGFEVKTQQQLDKTITWIAVIFLVVAILLNKPRIWKHTPEPEQGSAQESTK